MKTRKVRRKIIQPQRPVGLTYRQWLELEQSVPEREREMAERRRESGIS